MNYKLKLITQSPVFIGSGEKITTIDYFQEGNEIYVVDFDEFLKIYYEVAGGNYKKCSEELTRFIKKNLYNGKLKNKELFYRKEIRDEIRKRKAYIRKIYSDNIEGRDIQINEFINSAGRPYIPGSSIKGAIRTAIIYYILKKNANIRNQLFKEIDRTLYHKGLGEIVEKVLYGLDSKDKSKDLLKGLQITDSEFINDVKVKYVKSWSLSTWKSKVPMNLECVDADVAISAEMNINENLLKHSKVEDEFFKISKENILSAIKEFCQDLIDHEIKKTERYKEIQNFYSRLYDDHYIILGGYASFLSKTVSILIEKENKELWLKIKRKNERKYKRSFLTCRNFITQRNEPKAPLGWVKIEII